jgi:hypothetical protein
VEARAKQKKRVVSHHRIEMATIKKIHVVTVAAVMLLLMATMVGISQIQRPRGLLAIQHRLCLDACVFTPIHMC